MLVTLEECDFTDGCDPPAGPVPHAGASSAAGDLADDIAEEFLHDFIDFTE